VVPLVPVLITVPPANKASKSTKPLHVLALEKLFSQELLAEGEDLICRFSEHSKEMQTAMLNFHAAGLAGKHGGVRFLVSNAFSHGACMSWQRIASIQESFQMAISKLCPVCFHVCRAKEKTGHDCQLSILTL
jgi:hypothetical protein